LPPWIQTWKRKDMSSRRSKREMTHTTSCPATAALMAIAALKDMI